jgi:hypothetical protein
MKTGRDHIIVVLFCAVRVTVALLLTGLAALSQLSR